MKKVEVEGQVNSVTPGGKAEYLYETYDEKTEGLEVPRLDERICFLRGDHL